MRRRDSFCVLARKAGGLVGPRPIEVGLDRRWQGLEPSGEGQVKVVEGVAAVGPLEKQPTIRTGERRPAVGASSPLPRQPPDFTQ